MQAVQNLDYHTFGFTYGNAFSFSTDPSMIKPFIGFAVEENYYNAPIKWCLKFADRSVILPNIL